VMGALSSSALMVILNARISSLEIKIMNLISSSSKMTK